MTLTAARAALPARAVGRGGARLGVPAASAGVGVLATLLGLVALLRADIWRLSALADVPVDATIGVSFSLVGLVVLAAAKPNRPIGWLLVTSGVAGGLSVLVTAGAAVAMEPSGWARLAVQLESWLWVPAFVPLLTLLPLLFPDGLLPGRPWRLAAVAAIVGTALAAVAVAVHPEDFEGRIRIAKPITSDLLATIAAVPAALLLVPACGAAVVGVIVRWRRAEPLRRRQLDVFLTAVALLVVDALAQPLLPSAIGAATQAVAVALLPIAIGFAVTRHRLYDLDLAISRGLVAVSLAGCLAGVYLTLFALLRGLGSGGSWSSALAAGVTGLLVQPLAVRLARGVDRLFYGDRADPFAVSASLAARLSGGLDVLEVPQVVCDSVVESLRLGGAALSVVVDGADGSVEHDVATAGTVAERDVGFDLRYRGERIGRLLVAPRAGERELDPRDQELLAALGDQVAPALSAVRLYQALQRSREALVAAREEERRRLRHDLHDGVGAALAGVRLQLESARELVPDPIAGRLLDAAASGVAEAVGDVRRVTEDLRPPALDDLGLLGSLGALTERLDSFGGRVRAELPYAAPPGLSAAVEVACYRIAAEALSNAVRHSGAEEIVLRLAVEEGGLVLTVRDNGVAVRTARPGGLGLSSMRARAEEIGGRCEIAMTEAGSTVRATLPGGGPR